MIAVAGKLNEGEHVKRNGPPFPEILRFHRPSMAINLEGLLLLHPLRRRR
jgi:hypothetical protein